MRRYFFQTIFQMALIFLIVVLGIIGSEYVFNTYHPGWLGFILIPTITALHVACVIVRIWSKNDDLFKA